MKKTQIQVPDELFQELRDFARRREWSLAESFRRGAELLLQTYPREPASARKSWAPPVSGERGWKGMDDATIKDAISADQEPMVAESEQATFGA